MGFRFRRSVRILPGVRLNFSKSGISTSLGPRGSTINLGPRGPRYTVGLPGTGLSYSERLRIPSQLASVGAPSGDATGNTGLGCVVAIAVLFVLVVIGIMSTPRTLTSGNQTATAATSFQPRAGVVGASMLRCRMDPTTEGAVVGTLARGTPVQVLNEQNGWARIEHEGADCWVSLEFISTVQ